MERGYVKLWRKTLDSGLLTSPDVSQLFLYFLLKASWKEHKMFVGKTVVELKPGQLVFGRVQAAKELKTSEQRIRTALDCLKELKIVNQQATSKFSVISLLNWDTYQNQDSASNQQINQQATSKQPASNHKQEVKEGKEENTLFVMETTNKTKVRNRVIYTPEFELLWKAHDYGTKSKAFAEFKLMDSPPPITELVQILSEQVRLRTMRRKAEIFEDSLPHLERWIRERRWESGVPKEEEFDEARKNMKVEAWAV